MSNEIDQEVISLAREAGIYEPETDWMFWKAMERFAGILRADERGACAEVCDDLLAINWGPEQCATAIRARGEK